MAKSTPQKALSLEQFYQLKPAALKKLARKLRVPLSELRSIQAVLTKVWVA